MAHDTKRLKTLTWLKDLAEKKPTGLKEAFNPYRNKIMIRFGRLYAQNGYILASVDYPEFEHVGDDEWLELESLYDSKGYAFEFPTFKFMDKAPNDNRRFEDFFIKKLEYDCTQPFNARLIANCMKPFIINDIHPVISQNGCYLEFSGHNKDVSIKVLMIGVRK